MIWNHDHKGRIEGTTVKDEDEWLTIRLTKDHSLTHGRMLPGIEHRPAGSLLTVRKKLLTVVEPTTEPATAQPE